MARKKESISSLSKEENAQLQLSLEQFHRIADKLHASTNKEEAEAMLKRAEEARRLLLSAMDHGAPAEEALAVLERLNRLEAAVNAPLPERALRVSRQSTDRCARK